jgi:ketosteroid isomerase-like protein
MDLPRALHVTTRWIPLLACVALAAAQAPADPVSQIRAARERSNRALAMHDIKTFAESLAADFVIVRGNGVFMPSRQAWMDAVEADFRNPNAVRYERIPDKIEMSSVAPIAAEHGHWTATLPNGKRAYTGTYLAMWRRGETGWQIRSELFVLLGCEDEATCAGYRK